MNLVDNGLRVTLADNSELQFVVNNRTQLVEKLEASDIDIQ